MLKVSFTELILVKKVPLAISRGTSTGSRNLFVTVSDGVHEGIGEAAPGAGYDDTLADVARADLDRLLSKIDLNSLSIAETWQLGMEEKVASPALAALDMALWDLRAKQAGMPLYKLLGLSPKMVPTSVTVGLGEPDVTAQRTKDVLSQTGGKSLKIKLGSPEGAEFDKAHFLAAYEAAKPFGVQLRVDANGGWSVPTAIEMIRWLADYGVDYVEQPLVEGNEDGLPELQKHFVLPIYVDESCRTSRDIPKWGAHVQGVNLKLMKCGGITEALRIVAVARAFRLKTMIGCMGESSVAIGAGAAIGSLFDCIDLDSHLNLNPDPAVGLGFEDGCVVVSEEPGLGVRLREG